MPRTNNVSVQNNFSKGLITEATGLTFPENACTDADNCAFNHFGLCSRRLGFDFENQFETYTQDTSGSVIVSYLWNNVAGEGDLAFVAVQMGDNLHFYRVSSDNPLSGNKHANIISLVTFAPAGVTSVSTLECQFSSGNGLLFVTNRRLNSFYVEYDLDTDTFTATAINLQIRDLEGDSADPQAIDARPTTNLAGLNASHRYNLENQGWTSTTLTSWDTARTDMPANTDVSWYYKSAADAFDFSLVANRFVGNSPAPKGHYIYNLYNVNRSSNTSGATDFAIDLERVNTSAFFAGRVFYSGLNAERQNSKIFFSQVIEDKSQYGKCYETNDPSSEQLFDLLPTDGGVIDIIEAGSIIKMIPVLNSLIVFTARGVWSITGSQGIGFAANDYSVQKISSTVNISHTSFVYAEGVPYWWGLEGIYTISLDPQTNSIRVNCISDPTIRTFFLDIPSESKLYARGVYDQFTKRIQWIYRANVTSSFNDKYVYNRMLTLDLLSNAFYPWSISDDNVHINSIVNVFGFSGVFEENNVVNGANNVVSSGNQVIVFQAGNSGLSSVIKYFVSYTSSGAKVTFAENYNDNYLDWESFDNVGEEYDSFFITGYVVRGQGIKRFQQNYVNIFSRNDVDSSFKIIGFWDFANEPASGQWTSAQTMSVQTVTALRDSYKYKPKRIKIRGQGYSCQMKIFNNGTNPFNIIGWSVFETGNQWI